MKQCISYCELQFKKRSGTGVRQQPLGSGSDAYIDTTVSGLNVQLLTPFPPMETSKRQQWWSNNWIPATHVGDVDCAPRTLLQPQLF